MKDLSKKKLDQFSKAVEAAEVALREEIAKIAEQSRAEILPYFKKQGYGFRAGNGSWLISKPAAAEAGYYKPDNYVEDADLPKNIRDLLMLEIGHGDHLGFYIRDIKQGEW